MTRGGVRSTACSVRCGLAYRAYATMPRSCARPVASGRRQLARYRIRAPFSLEKSEYKGDSGVIVYRSRPPPRSSAMSRSCSARSGWRCCCSACRTRASMGPVTTVGRATVPAGCAAKLAPEASRA